MSKELQDQLALLLSNLQGAATQGVAFAKQEIPPLIREKILLGRVETSLAVGFGIICLLLVFPLIICAVRKFSESVRLGTEKSGLYSYREDVQLARQDLARREDVEFIYGLVSSVGVLVTLCVGCVVTFDNLHTLMLVWFAPRLYIIEWLSTLLKK